VGNGDLILRAVREHETVARKARWPLTPAPIDIKNRSGPNRGVIDRETRQGCARIAEDTALNLDRGR
jgi:hypothetical protein